jgi:hypothetical protein
MKVAAQLGASYSGDNLMATAHVSHERKHNTMAGIAGGVRLYETATEVNGWLTVGVAHVWHTQQALHSGEGIRNRFVPTAGFRFDYGRIVFQLQYASSITAGFIFKID